MFVAVSVASVGDVVFLSAVIAVPAVVPVLTIPVVSVFVVAVSVVAFPVVYVERRKG